MPVVYRKLVRDRIPEIIQSQGRHPVTRVLDDAGYREALLSELVEEARDASSQVGRPALWERRHVRGAVTGLEQQRNGQWR
jgi:hypothetical protein